MICDGWGDKSTQKQDIYSKGSRTFKGPKHKPADDSGDMAANWAGQAIDCPLTVSLTLMDLRRKTQENQPFKFQTSSKHII